MDHQPLIPLTSPLRRFSRVPRFVRNKLCILVVRNDYHVQAECIEALRLLGHRVIEIRLGEKGGVVEPSQNLEAILRAVVTHRPDMMLSVNYTGFDRVNWMGEVIDAVGLPTAVWLVDSPFFMAQGYLNLTSKHTTLFSWDKSYVSELKRLGAHRVLHLPLGTSEQLFRINKTKLTIAYEKSFVGHTLVVLEDRWRKRLTPPEVLQGEAWANELESDRQSLHQFVPNPRVPIDRPVLVLAFANMVASKRYRQSRLQAVADHKLHVFGDEHWPRVLPKAQAHQPVAYGAPLATLFARTAVNINATNLQMPSTVNQRVFDVPQAGGFLLTDRQPEQEAYFVPEIEMATYQSAEELKEKSRYYLAHPQQRRLMVERAQRRIQAEHTYCHRLATLIEHMRALPTHTTSQAPPLASTQSLSQS